MLSEEGPLGPKLCKGGLQYISNPDDFKTMGRKV